jgi:dipeptidyl-peptidase-3
VQQCTDSEAREPRSHEIETVGDTGVLRLYADGFVELAPRERVLAYWLSQAAVAGDPIVYDQRSRYGLAVKELCEELALHLGAIEPALRQKIELFVKRVFIDKGLYDGWTQRKQAPPLDRKQLESAALAAFEDGARLPGVKSEADLRKYLAALERVLFDPAFEPVTTTKSAPRGKDIVTASSNTYYEGLTLKDLAAYSERHPLNSRLVKRGGKIEEIVYRAGSSASAPPVPAGLYAAQLERMVDALERALPFASESQAKVLAGLVRYLRTGEHEDFRRYGIAWVKDDSPVDAILGFIETYGDPRGVHAEYEGAVFAVDRSRTALMKKVAAHAAYFEQRMPWLDKYKRTDFTPPVANAVLTLTLTGGAGPVAPVGINLPNEQDIREKHGSKNFFLTSVEEAVSSVTTRVIGQSFLYDPAMATDYRRCAPAIVAAMVSLHEVTGHGSGKVSPGLVKDPRALLREYGSTLEEARADLVALHASWDPKAIEIGLLPDERCVQMAAHSYLAYLLLRLRLVPAGELIEEDHIRAASLVARWAVDRGAVKPTERDGKVFLVIQDWAAWRKAVADLLAELMRVKAEGDFAKARELVERYGARLEPRWRDDAVKRVREAGMPTRFAFVSPRVKPLLDDKGAVVDAVLVDSLGLVETALVDAGKKRLP